VDRLEAVGYGVKQAIDRSMIGDIQLDRVGGAQSDHEVVLR
jgi:hypothetical protein